MLIAADDAGSVLSDLAHSGVLSWIVLGLLVGAVAKILLPGRDPGGVFGTMLIGIAGAFLGGWLSAKFFDRPISHNVVDPRLWVAAVGGALVLLVLYRVFFGNSREHHH